MIKIDNKGFTIIEIIIAISICTVVIGLGYRTINGTNKALQNQFKIFNEQQTTNLVNNFFTKDIETAKSITNINIDDSGNIINRDINKSTTYSYGYAIELVKNDEYKIVTYTVNVVGSSKKEYSITREEDGNSIEIVSNLQFSYQDGSVPLQILYQGNQLYLIDIVSGKNNYEFKVNSRISEIIPSNNKNEYIGTGIKIEHGNPSYLKIVKENGECENVIKVPSNKKMDIKIIFDSSYATIYIDNIEKIKIIKNEETTKVNINSDHKELYKTITVNSTEYSKTESIEVEENIHIININDININNGAKKYISIIWK